MASRKYTLLCLAFAGTTAAAALLTPAAAAPWVRGYVVGYYHPAFYFGGKADYQKPGELDPGPDCPKGANYPTQDIPYVDFLSAAPWRSNHDLQNIVNSPGYDTVRDYLRIKQDIEENELQYRGFRKGINTFMNPYAAPDPGMQEVTGKIALGFDLDGNPNTGGFTSPDGQRGIDNAYYRAVGCNQGFRGTPLGNNGENNSAGLSQRANDAMLEGLFTIVIRISGNQDPMNDSNATLEIGYSPEQIVLNAQSNLARGYSYQIDTKNIYNKLKATIKNGVVETESVPGLTIPKFGREPVDIAYMTKARIQLKLNPDGSFDGLIGGYEDWRYLYWGITAEQGGALAEELGKLNETALYYSLKRNADGMPDPKTGQNTGISIAWRIAGTDAFVVDPPKPVELRIPSKRQHDGFRNGYPTLVESITTKKILGVPAGLRGGGGGLDKSIAEYPNAAELKAQINHPTPMADKDFKAIVQKQTPRLADPAWPMAEPVTTGQQPSNKQANSTVPSNQLASAAGKQD